jgi:predicted DNA-binding transcriptional regulator AlpA
MGARTIEAFCKDHGFSRAFFYKLMREGRGPRVMKVGARTLVSDEAAADWRRAMEVANESAA